jgi:Arc/MetJ-type ribon-helix-helix transcriptional regulator
MVNGMATKKVTITLPDKQIEEVRALVSAGKTASLSGFVQHAVAVALHDAAGWRELLGDALNQTGGPLTHKEREWADAVLDPKPDKRKPEKGRVA